MGVNHHEILKYYLQRTLSKLLDVNWTTFAIATAGKNIYNNNLNHMNKFHFTAHNSIHNTM